MKTLEQCQWKPFSLVDVFDIIKRGKRLKNGDHKAGFMPYASSSAVNNSIDDFVCNDEGVRIFKDCLSLANSGSVGATFYHPYAYVASDHVTSLQKIGANKYVYLFLANMVSRLGEKYGFNREINDNRIKREVIMLPIKQDGTPDYKFMEEYMREKEKMLLAKYQAYLTLCADNQRIVGGVICWKPFALNEVFEIKSSVRLTKSNMQDGLTPFIGASDSNNGITAFVSNMNSSLDSNVLGVNYNGSVVENFYHPYTALFSDDVKRLHLKKHKDDKYIFLFMKNVILKQKVKFQYGYKFNGERMDRQQIMLPAKQDGTPDYDYMATYMRNIEYKLLSQYVNTRLLTLSA